jgi:hypothetical protein
VTPGCSAAMREAVMTGMRTFNILSTPDEGMLDAHVRVIDDVLCSLFEVRESPCDVPECHYWCLEPSESTENPWKILNIQSKSQTRNVFLVKEQKTKSFRRHCGYFWPQPAERRWHLPPQTLMMSSVAAPHWQTMRLL